MKHVYTSIFTLALLAISSNSFAQGPNGSGEYYKSADGKKAPFCKVPFKLIFVYKMLWNDFKTTDVRSDGKVWDMYSNITNFTFGTDQDSGNHSYEGKAYNREHSFPKSWFGGKVMPMYADLFHLYPTDGKVNENRGDLPFGETNGSNKNSANDFSKIGVCTYPGYTGTVFEPNDIYKGDFARTYFYMVTCYEEKLPDWVNKGNANITINSSGLVTWQLEMLMKWSKNDPVSADKETPRNNAVYSIQGNRNPFIDYPGLEEYIWGSLKDVAFSYDQYQSPTAIMTIKAEPTYKEGVMYNLSGQVVDKSYKGIVIMNGKKFVNK